MNPQLEKLKNLITLVNEGLSKDEFIQAFKSVLAIVTKIESNLIAKIDAKLAQIKNGKDGKDGRDGRDGKDGKQGPRGERGLPGYALFGAKGEQGAPGKDGSPDTPEQVRDKLETLEGEERLDAKFVKNLPENVNRVIATSTSLWHLQDVDVSGIAVGQSIKWDGVRWIPFTPSGGNTAVYNEVVSGSGTSFTLANSPVAGTERLYANGQRLTPTTDYTISGSGITTNSSWASGTITADYEY